MDRIVLRAPENEIRVIHRPIFPTALSIIAIVVSILLSPHEKSSQDGSSTTSPQYVDDWRDFVENALLVSCSFYLFLQIWKRLREFFGFRAPQRFQEAALEITPLGVQLVSVYGTGHDYSKEEHRVREFLPMQQIVDVIVMEVVWPHCVWSQLAFRVLKGHVVDEECDDSSMGSHPEDGERNGAHLPRSDSNKSIKESSRERRSLCRFHNIHKLLEQDRVAIISCFPEECRGWLTYQQCLYIQAEIDKLLSISSEEEMQ